MGHSMGGLIAQILATRVPAKALVLLTPASPSGIMALKPSVIKCFLNVFLRWGFWKKPHRVSADKMIYACLEFMTPEERKAICEQVVYESGRATAEIGMWLFDPNKATRVDESKVKCPVLVVSGKEDKITPHDVVEQVAKKYQALEDYRCFENHAHWVIGEPGWEDIAQYVADWLKEKLED